MNFNKFRKTSEEAPTEDVPAVDGIVTTGTEGSDAIIVLSGRIDATNFEEINRTASDFLKREDVHSLIFDMSAVTYVSSAGLRTFSSVNQLAIELEKTYKLTKMRGDILKLFQMTGYASAFYIESTEN